MNPQTWMVVGGVCVLAVAGGAYAWLRLPLYRWACRHCKTIVTVSRFHPGRCTCGAGTLVAYYCGACGSWNTLPSASRHCVACSSKGLIIGAEYNFSTRFIRMRNRDSRNRNRGTRQRSMV
jgi:hypothetical protein